MGVPITVRRLSDAPDLRITIRSGHEHVDREISWAHVSELDDPTAFLSGGELLLTTGVSLPDDAARIEQHVRRLVGAGIAAIGFGTGLRYDSVPEPLLDATRRHEVPLLEIPLEVPFILVEKAVSRALSADDHARLQLSHQQQRRLIHAALDVDGAHTLVRRTAELIGGWTAQLDSAGRTVDSSHRAAHRVVAKTADARARRPREVVFATDGGEDVISQPLTAANGDILGYLVAGRKGVVGSLDHGVVTVAASLLTLFVRHTEEARQALGRSRSNATKLLFSGEVVGVRAIADNLWGGLPEPPVHVITARGQRHELTAALKLFDSDFSGSSTFAADDGGLTLITAQAAVERYLGCLAHLSGLGIGISAAHGWNELERARYESRRAAERSVHSGRPVHYTEISGGGLGSFIDRDGARTFAENHLLPLRRNSGEPTPLLDTLRIWLSHNGHTDPAAKALGIHRHTLRRRLDRIESLLEVSIASPTTRAELWLELTLLGYADDL